MLGSFLTLTMILAAICAPGLIAQARDRARAKRQEAA